MTKKPVRHRDSVDGRFITEKEAKKRPRETETEVIKPSKSKPSGKKSK